MVTLQAGVGKACVVIMVMVLLGESLTPTGHAQWTGIPARGGAVEWNVQLTAASKAAFASFLLSPPHPLHGLDLIPGSGFFLDSILPSGFLFC